MESRWSNGQLGMQCDNQQHDNEVAVHTSFGFSNFFDDLASYFER